MILGRWMVLAVASVGFSSFLPYRLVPFAKWKGGGFIGSLAGWALLMALPNVGGVYWAATVLILASCVPVCHYAEKFLGNHDDPRIIYDEVAGMWVSALFLPKDVWTLALAFVFFRLFDVLKGPWGRWASRAPGGWGVAGDDLVAGLLANVFVRLSLSLFPQFLVPR
ncbi:MAG TPA: phosphatidylglycerophosphatase A [Elusimicrobiota bacterium]|nr:phosphatidylglycerophosphatase A [Elusimicrobiota bacterium]